MINDTRGVTLAQQFCARWASVKSEFVINFKKYVMSECRAISGMNFVKWCCLQRFNNIPDIHDIWNKLSSIKPMTVLKINRETFYWGKRFKRNFWNDIGFKKTTTALLVVHIALESHTEMCVFLSRLRHILVVKKKKKVNI